MHLRRRRGEVAAGRDQAMSKRRRQSGRRGGRCCHEGGAGVALSARRSRTSRTRTGEGTAQRDVYGEEQRSK